MTDSPAPREITYRRVAAIALPVVLSNATVPLQGAIDTAIIGNLGDAVYLAAVTLFEWWRGQSIQNHFYLWMFLLHLALGLLIIVPTLVYGVVHWRNAKDHRNRRAVAAGY